VCWETRFTQVGDGGSFATGSTSTAQTSTGEVAP
jgi:hypothetical protein